MVGIGHSLHQHVGGQNRDAETAHPVGLHGEASLAGHTFYDHSDIGPGLHGLIGCQVADVAGSDRKDVLAQERKLGVHHPLDHGGGVDSGHIVVLEGRHEGHGSSGDDQLVGIHIEDLVGSDILDRQPLAFEDIPDHRVQHNALVRLPGQSPGYIESPHPSETLFLLEEEELMGLHQELTAYLAVAVDYQTVHALFQQLLADCQTGRSGTDNGHGSPVDLLFLLHAVLLCDQNTLEAAVGAEPGELPDTVHLGYADTADLAVHEHLTGTAFADTALHGPLAVVETETVYRTAGLVQGGGYGLPPLPCYCFTLKLK